MLALIVASLGFLSKLVAEAVEEMSMKPVEAVRATGSPFLSVVIMGVLPQVMRALHRLFRLPARFQPAQFGAGRHRRRRRHRRDPVHRVPALRLRLRAHHRARDHRHRHGRRDPVGLDAQAVPMTTADVSPDGRGNGSASRCRSASCARRSISWSSSRWSGRCAPSRSSRNSSTTRRSRPPTCSRACGRSTGPGIRRSCTRR